VAGYPPANGAKSLCCGINICLNYFFYFMIYALILTGTLASGKTTISKLLAIEAGWKRISEDEIWKKYFDKNRGAFGSEEYRKKRQVVHETVFTEILSINSENKYIVIDAAVHESPPEAYYEYKEFFETHNIKWHLCILHPRLEIAIKRDSQRIDWVAGPERVESLRAKFNGWVFPKKCFIDNSDDTPNQTMKRIIQICEA
jgi:adenylate kinase family enzyme